MQKSYQVNTPQHDNKSQNKQTKKALGHNKGLNAMGAEVVNSTFVLLMNFCSKLNICAFNTPLRQAPNRWLSLK